MSLFEFVEWNWKCKTILLITNYIGTYYIFIVHCTEHEQY